MQSDDIFPVLERAVEIGASDIHLVVGRPPMVRVKGSIGPLEEFQPLSHDNIKGMIYGVLFDEQKQKFEETLELDCSYNIPGLSRFRLNVHMHKDGTGAVLRVIGSQIPTPEQLMLSEAVTKLTALQKGLVLVTGPTGSGKSTTLASLIELINQTRRDHILTIEDPIEFVYDQKYCVITQREVGSQTLSFANALKSSLRQDPDIILVGEMRDLETISLAISAAETGHLVFGTLHTSDAPQTIDRIVDVFPPYQQQQIRVQLANSLKAVVCQILIARADGKGRVAAREILIVNSGISSLIREGKTHQLYGALETGGKLGMITMDKSLSNLFLQGLITNEEALAKCHDPDQLNAYLR
ncbi:MAG: type IV pilus twitching motility protein PilT [bacterium]